MAAPTPPQSDATPTQGLIPRHEFGSSSTPTPSRRNRDGVGDGCETDGQWDSSAEAAAASAGESSSEEDCRRNSEIIRARLYEKQAIRHREEREARSTPPLPSVAEEEAAQADPGATAAPGVAETQQPASAPEILRITDPMLLGIPHDPVRAAESRRRFLMNTESFGANTLEACCAQDRCAGATTAGRGRQTW